MPPRAIDRRRVPRRVEDRDSHVADVVEVREDQALRAERLRMARRLLTAAQVFEVVLERVRSRLLLPEDEQQREQQMDQGRSSKHAGSVGQSGGFRSLNDS